MSSALARADMKMTVERAPSVRVQVASILRDAIVRRRLNPGDLIVEREICDWTGASRASVREALRQLESEGLVMSQAGRGTTVVSLSRDEIINIYEVRAALEGLAGELFTLRANDGEISLLSDVVDRLMSVDSDAALELKNEFYRILFDGARNPELSRTIGLIHVRATLLRAVSLSTPGRLKDSVKELQDIVEAIRKGDSGLARARCIEHVKSACAIALLNAADVRADPADPAS